MMRGLPGSKIKLKLRRQGKKQAITIKIKRSIIKIRSTIDHKLGENIMLVKLTTFHAQVKNYSLFLKNLVKILKA